MSRAQNLRLKYMFLQVFTTVILSFYLFLQPITKVYASYVLPYPSFMPGHKLYYLSRAIDYLGQWWNFGSIAQTKYHLQKSDKYLVEARILFEYGQYPLALNALSRSDDAVGQLEMDIRQVRKDGKDPQILKKTIVGAMSAHQKILSRLEQDLPPVFLWQPEKAKASELRLGEVVRASNRLREMTLITITQ